MANKKGGKRSICLAIILMVIITIVLVSLTIYFATSEKNCKDKLFPVFTTASMATVSTFLIFSQFLSANTSYFLTKRTRPFLLEYRAFKLIVGKCRDLGYVDFILEDVPKMPVTKEAYGTTESGDAISIFTLQNGQTEVKVLDYGAIITSIRVPDKDGNVDDVNLGFDAFTGGYDKNPPYLGALVGRYANRIAKGHFTLDGVTYNLTVNNGPNALHGGTKGFDKRLWTSSFKDNSLVLEYTSLDGEEHYPGEVKVKVTYTLTSRNELILDYHATTNKKTVINLTNHAYFNLAGHAAGNLNGHMVKLAAANYTPVDDTSIPLGSIDSVKGTKFDLTSTTNLVQRLPEVPGDIGFDHNFVLGDAGWDKHAARMIHTPSGRQLDMYTTEPGVQFYTAFYLNETNAKGGATYGKWGAFCLEAQHYPDSPNQPTFPTTVLSPGETYRQTTKYVFSVVES